MTTGSVNDTNGFRPETSEGRLINFAPGKFGSLIGKRFFKGNFLVLGIYLGWATVTCAFSFMFPLLCVVMVSNAGTA